MVSPEWVRTRLRLAMDGVALRDWEAAAPRAAAEPVVALMASGWLVH
jgi:hypothetical protein